MSGSALQCWMLDGLIATVTLFPAFVTDDLAAKPARKKKAAE